MQEGGNRGRVETALPRYFPGSFTMRRYPMDDIIIPEALLDRVKAFCEKQSSVIDAITEKLSYSHKERRQ